MAAIISQMAANKRARQKEFGHRVISSDKCVYSLPPFDPCFDPKVHNKYIKSLVQKKLYDEFLRTERERKRKRRKKRLKRKQRRFGFGGGRNYDDDDDDTDEEEEDDHIEAGKEKKARKKRKTKAALPSDLISGVAILAFGFGSIVLLVVYVWVVLWKVK